LIRATLADDAALALVEWQSADVAATVCPRVLSLQFGLK
jgi:hypothetical protein